RLNVERADVGDEAQNLDAGILGKIEQAGVLAPIRQRIGPRDNGQLYVRQTVAQNGPDFAGEEPVGDHVREMAKRADEQEPPAAALDFGKKAVEVHSIGNDGSRRWRQLLSILLRHDDQPGVTSHPSLLESPPAPKIPPCRKAELALMHL